MSDFRIGNIVTNIRQSVYASIEATNWQTCDKTSPICYPRDV
jgi:uncharacterized protein (DUF779 family)